MPEVNRFFYLPKIAETIGVPVKTLQAAVRAVLLERARETVAKRLEEDRAAKLKAEAAAQEQRDFDRVRREEKRERREAKKQQDREQQQAEKKAEREQRLAEQRAEREARKAEQQAAKKAAAKAKGFSVIMRLPVALHERELDKLAKQIDQDVTALRSDFQDYIGVAEGSLLVETEPWPEPIDLAALLDAVEAKIAKHVVMRPLQHVAVTLNAAQTWPHNDIATHSPILVPSSPEQDHFARRVRAISAEGDVPD
jgi:hypothetical protein